MKIGQFSYQGKRFIGLVGDNRVMPLPRGMDSLPWSEVLSAFMDVSLRSRGEQVLTRKRDFLVRGRTYALSDITYSLPVMPESKILCVGLNYTDHAKEGNQPIPDYPVFFTRFYSSFVAQNEALILPKVSYKFDYEAELAIVVGKTLRHATPEQAQATIFGYTIAMDGSIRDYQKRHSQWTLGKNFDASGALGPWVITADALPENAQGLAVQTRLNGQLLQNGNTADMIFKPAQILATLSEVMTLNPGDVVLTGTPAGVGFARDPYIYLKPGDRLETVIEGIGVLENSVQAE